MRFEADLRRAIFNHLPLQGKPAEKALLEAESISKLLIIYLNWRDRLVHSHPRRVLKSAQLLTNPVYLTRRSDVHLIFAKVAVGQDINPHLSRRIEFGFEQTLPGKKVGRHIDLLLNEWGVHHLHLSGVVENDGYVARADDVLCAIFRDQEAYFLDVIKHNEWAEQRLVEAAVRSWPEAELFLQLSVLGSERDITASERQAFRQKGGNAAVNVDGRVYIPRRGGLTTACTPFDAVIRTDRLLSCLRSYEEKPDVLARELRRIGRSEVERVRWPIRPRYRLLSVSTPNAYCFVIKEEDSGLMMALPC